MKKLILLYVLLCSVCTFAAEHKLNVVLPKNANNRVAFAAEYLQKKLSPLGFEVVVTSEAKSHANAECQVFLAMADGATVSTPAEGMKKEGFTITAQIGRAHV